jgi:hypothetical protein
VPSLLDDVIRQPVQQVPLVVQQRLVASFPGRHVLYATSDLFRIDRFADAGQCTRRRSDAEPSLDATWLGDTRGTVTSETLIGWSHVGWRDHDLEVVTLELPDDCGSTRHHWLVAADRALAERFFLAVTDWNATSHGEVLVFEAGHFSKNESLYAAITATRFEDLVLPVGQADGIRDDVRRFLGAKALYAQHRVPWKRGLLLVGPPGNGKTHMVRAIVREAARPCLYVKSLRANHSGVEDNLAEVFDRARRAAPCVVVLEDLDCLVDDSSRSVLLNELDGFAVNDGLLIIATTNHPEKLDRSLLDRPSRFDRKFHFGLPAQAERLRYLEQWQASVEPALKLTPAVSLAVAEGTHGFSFAYLKELTLAAMLAFMEAPVVGRMDEVILSVLEALRGEMSSAQKVLPPLPGTERRISLSA